MLSYPGQILQYKQWAPLFVLQTAGVDFPPREENTVPLFTPPQTQPLRQPHVYPPGQSYEDVAIQASLQSSAPAAALRYSLICTHIWFRILVLFCAPLVYVSSNCCCMQYCHSYFVNPIYVRILFVPCFVPFSFSELNSLLFSVCKRLPTFYRTSHLCKFVFTI